MRREHKKEIFTWFQCITGDFLLCLYEYVAGEYNVLFPKTYYNLEINSYMTEEYLEDGSHLMANSWQVYADALARLILGPRKI